MPYDIRIISSADFLRLDAQGRLDMQTSRRLLSDAMWASMQCGVDRILLDVREATCDMTASQIMSLGAACRDLRSPGVQHRIAVLNRPKDDFDRTAFAASIAQAEGRNTRAFQSFEEALNWLNEP